MPINIDELFATNVNTPSLDDVTADVLVGEDRKYKTADDLAKAYVSADSFIENLKAENARLAAEKKVLEDLSKNSLNNPSEPAPRATEHNAPVERNADEGKIDITAKIREEFLALDEEKKKAANINAAAETMTKFYGSPEKAKEALSKRAVDLGVSAEWLLDAAAKSPNAFYASMGITPNATGSSSPNADVGNDAVFRGNPTGQKGMKYWNEIRKSNPKLYYSRDMQRQMFESRKAMGDNFYSS